MSIPDDLKPGDVWFVHAGVEVRYLVKHGRNRFFSYAVDGKYVDVRDLKPSRDDPLKELFNRNEEEHVRLLCEYIEKEGRL